jgi:hypothetical protein
VVSQALIPSKRLENDNKIAEALASEAIKELAEKERDLQLNREQILYPEKRFHKIAAKDKNIADLQLNILEFKGTMINDWPNNVYMEKMATFCKFSLNVH